MFTGPQQFGKTVIAFTIPILYHLFELEETVVLGVPTGEMATDKWENDLLPIIQRTRYAHLLPSRGKGSRGGSTNLTEVRFQHGPTLKLMTGGGGDKKRSGYTSRVVVITETDGMDEPGGASREGDKISQIEGRTQSYGKRAQVYMECIVSIERGRTWTEYMNGTQSRIFIRCPHCKGYVSPEREHLVGWEEAETEGQAGRQAAWCCPACGELWSEDDRRRANLDCKLVHRGQEIDSEGNVTGPLPDTPTLGFRCSAVNNLFVEPEVLGQEEWRARRTGSEHAETALRQQRYTLPALDPIEAAVPLEVDAIRHRQRKEGRGIVPDEAERLVAAVDIGKHLLHWGTAAVLPDHSIHVVDYGMVEVPWRSLGLERAIAVALGEINDIFKAGFRYRGVTLTLKKVLCDAGYETTTVYDFLRPLMPQWLPSMGFGHDQHRPTYNAPKSTGNVIIRIGRDWHEVKLTQQRVHLIEMDADEWKSRTHERLVQPIDQAGAVTLFAASPNDHLTVAQHLTAEEQIIEFVDGREKKRWHKVRRQNHFLDVLYQCLVAADMTAPPAIRAAQPNPSPQPQPPGTDYGFGGDRPFLITER